MSMNFSSASSAQQKTLHISHNALLESKGALWGFFSFYFDYYLIWVNGEFMCEADRQFVPRTGKDLEVQMQES